MTLEGGNTRDEKNETPIRFRLATEAVLKGTFSQINIVGEESLDKIPQNAKVIFATTHISDLDVVMPIGTLGKRFKIKAVNASMQHHITQDPVNYIGLHAVGKDNAIPVDYQWAEHPEAGDSYYASTFNPENFVPMQQALEEGNAITIAAYNPTHIKDGKLPPKGNYGAVYLAEISGAVIVPIAIHIKSDNPEIGTWKNVAATLKERPEADMIIGEPYAPQRIEGVEDFARAVAEHHEIHDVVDGLRRESAELMVRLAALLPEEKRGEWNKK